MANTFMTSEVYLPWASSAVEPVFDLALAGGASFVAITALLHGKATRSVSLSVPSRLTVADLKGHLAVEGVVPTCGGLSLALEEAGPALDDGQALELAPGGVVHLRRAAAMVHVTVLTTDSPGGALAGAGPDEEVYELVLPEELDGAALKEQITQATASALRPLAVFVAAGADDATPFSVAAEEIVRLVDDQVILVQREGRPAEDGPAASQLALAAAEQQQPRAAAGVLGALRQRFLGKAKQAPELPLTRPCLRSASNVRVKGATLSCTAREPWAGCAVFDVPDAAYFEITVKLLADAPSAEADGFAGRWMLGVAPSAAAEVKTEKQRRQLLGLGYFLTVCHGHPAKLHAPSMPRGTCGEDCPALPGELQKGQRLTLRWAAGRGGGALLAQVDDGDLVTLPYSPAPFDDVRPCLVMGGRPTEVAVVQLEAGGPLGGA